MVIFTSNSPSKLLLPSLPLAEWQDTYTTLHLWTQIVGKIRLALSPAVNHWWHSTFLQSTYEAAANLAHWDRGLLERSSCS